MTAWRCTPLRGWCGSCSAGPTCDCSPCRHCSWESTTSTCSLRRRTRCGRYCTLLSLGQVVGTTDFDFNLFPKEKTPMTGSGCGYHFPKEKTFPHPIPPAGTIASHHWVGLWVPTCLTWSPKNTPTPSLAVNEETWLCSLSTEPV